MFGPSNTPAPPPGNTPGKPAADTAPPPPASDLAYFLQRLITLEDPRINYALAAIILVIAGWAGWRLWSVRESSRVASAWADILAVPTTVAPGSTEDPVAVLQTILADQSSPALPGAIRLRLARALVERANEAGPTRDALLEQAEKELRQIVADASVPAQISAPATYLLATVQESRRDFAGARATLETLSDARFAGSPFQLAAKPRIDRIPDLERPVRFVPGDPPPPVGPPTPEETVPESAPAPNGNGAPEAAPGSAPASPDPAPAEPSSTEPTPGEPAPSEPAPTEPEPSDPASADPVPSEPGQPEPQPGNDPEDAAPTTSP